MYKVGFLKLNMNILGLCQSSLKGVKHKRNIKERLLKLKSEHSKMFLNQQRTFCINKNFNLSIKSLI